MQSLADAYNTYTEIDRMSDLDRLVNLATYTVETWPDKEQADAARMNLSQIYFGMGRYDEAIKALTRVRTRSQQWIPAQNRLGMVHWRKSRVAREPGRRAGAAGRGPEGDRFFECRPQGPPRRRHRRDRPRLHRQRRRPGDRIQRNRQADGGTRRCSIR